mgnify:FL=1
MNETIVTQPLEEWREIEQFPGYRVSNYGRLQSKWRVGRPGFTGRFVPWHDVAVQPYWRTNHLYRACRNREGRITTLWVARMELWGFKGPPPTPQHECRHLDGNSQNNFIGNLEWGTTQENSDDKFKHGNAIIGPKNHATELDELDVLWIRFLYDNRKTFVRRLTCREIGERIEISTQHVCSIGLRKDRKYVPEADTIKRHDAAR